MNSRRKFLATAGLGFGSVIGAAANDKLSSSGTIKTVNGLMYNVLNHGIYNDGKRKITPTINSLIQEINSSGGGTVFFPSGDYLSGAIHLKSNITLHLEPGANIIFSDDFDDYLPMVKSRWQGIDIINFSPLIYAYQEENIAITGRGTLNGMGKKWWDFVYRLRNEFNETGSTTSSKWQEEFYKNNSKEDDQSYGFCRPSLLQLIECKNIQIQGVRFQNSPFWTTHFVTCEDLSVDGITIFNEKSPNTDGINPESSKNVRISNCNIHASDDCITIKSGKNEWGRKYAKPCENITITNCIMTSGAAGIGIGSEVSGDIRRVTISNCIFDGTSNGIHIKTNRERGGVIEDISISNIVMNNIKRHPAIFINMKYWIESDPQPVTDSTPRIQNIHIQGVTGTNINKAISIVGLEEMFVKNISICQVNISSNDGLDCERVENLVLKDISITCNTLVPYIIKNSIHLDIAGIQSASKKVENTLLHLTNVQQVYISNIPSFDPDELFLRIEGKESQKINLTNSGLSKNNIAVDNGIDIKAII